MLFECSQVAYIHPDIEMNRQTPSVPLIHPKVGQAVVRTHLLLDLNIFVLRSPLKFTPNAAGHPTRT